MKPLSQIKKVTLLGLRKKLDFIARGALSLLVFIYSRMAQTMKSFASYSEEGSFCWSSLITLGLGRHLFIRKVPVVLDMNLSVPMYILACTQTEIMVMHAQTY